MGSGVDVGVGVSSATVTGVRFGNDEGAKVPGVGEEVAREQDVRRSKTENVKRKKPLNLVLCLKIFIHQIRNISVGVLTQNREEILRCRAFAFELIQVILQKCKEGFIAHASP